MKYLIAAAVILVVVFATEEPFTEENEQMAECMREFNATSEEFEKLRVGDLSDDSERVKCFVNCFYEKFGFLKDGKFQEEASREVILRARPNGKVDEFINICKDVEADSNCNAAWKLAQCYHNNKALLE